MPTSWPNTIAVIVLLSLVFALPLFMYLRIILKFLLDKSLQDELNKTELDTDQARPRTKDPSLVVNPILLSFKNVTYTVVRTEKQILKGISAWFAPGTLTAILGTSGCGKTTLLTTLADQIEVTGRAGGQVLVNGAPRSCQFRRVTAYVMQSDNLLESLTVRELLWFTCELRISAASNEHKLKIVMQTIEQLDLTKVASRHISVLSGGQKRRVTVAIELVSNPSLIFLDEATSGLDASGSLKLVKVLRNLANAGRTIVCTIHQPRIDAFLLFHFALLMNAGECLYFGPVSEILPYFDAENKLGNKVEEEEEEINPADFVLDLTHGAEEEVAQLVTLYNNSAFLDFTNSVIDRIHLGEVKPGEALVDASTHPTWFPELHYFPTKHHTEPDRLHGGFSHAMQLARTGKCNDFLGFSYTSTLWKQVFTLTRRALLNDKRNSSYIMSWVLGIIMMLFLGMLYSSVASPLYQPASFDLINRNLHAWGACSQNASMLALILNMTQADANHALQTCGEELNSSAQLAAARTSLLYQLLASMYFSEMPLVAQVHNDWQIFRREHASRAYSSLSWTLSWVIKIGFSGLVKGIVFPPFVYFSARLALEPNPYFLFSIFMGLMSTTGASMAFLCAVSFENLETATVLFVVINIVSQNLCGYFIQARYIPWWLRWYYYVNFFRYTFEGTVIGQALGLTVAQSPDFYNLAEEQAWLNALISVVFVVAYLLLGYMVVWMRSRHEPTCGCTMRRGAC